MDISNEATVAALLGLTIGLVKVIERLVDWALNSRKKSNGNGVSNGTNGHKTYVQLDPETTAYLRELQEKIHDIHATVAVKDSEGIPMMYSSRANNEDIKQVALCLRDVSNNQERIAETLEKTSERIELLERGQDEVIRIITSGKK